MPYERRPNPRCLRGLQFIYHVEPAPEVARLVDGLQAAFDDQLVVCEEPWPGRTVVRLIARFVAEFRLGERHGEVLVNHRVNTTEEQRRCTEEKLESVLDRL
ncbi:hypothetical protein FIV42_11495 [Persicimonas caeni]|jgi:hypothetical protein|uniref:Uncharacterized protein n=1 Tax=Persicimonas caeni TaxID=2292766 RepID=A0A4Y6PSN2_PERCE|nr:hypothetical protein [Persicimonas caeni]QDG51342.1 hypothetical protein FIV42_11495 [Persicimonas caeni]QED32563.1 hypothetical protein FRD00_11490 [Persicimonas caeni]